jgi:hypothetical protein
MGPPGKRGFPFSTKGDPFALGLFCGSSIFRVFFESFAKVFAFSIFQPLEDSRPIEVLFLYLVPIILLKGASTLRCFQVLLLLET